MTRNRRIMRFLLHSFLALLLLFPARPSAGQVKVRLSAGKTPEQIVKEVIMGNGVTITNVSFNGQSGSLPPKNSVQFGTFSNKEGSAGFFSSGIVLCTGSCLVAEGPNNVNGMTCPIDVSHTVHCQELSKLVVPFQVNCPAVLEFDFSSVTKHVAFRYIFASEEYPNYSCSVYNDVFGFFITDTETGKTRNIALIPGTKKPVSVNNVHPDYGEDCKAVNEEFLTMLPTGSPLTQFNGYVGPLTAEADLIPGHTYHMKLAISNVSDRKLESAVFIEALSFNAVDDYGFIVDGKGGSSLPPQLDTLSEKQTEGILAKDLMKEGNTQVVALDALGNDLAINPDDYDIIAETDLDFLFDEVSAEIKDGSMIVHLRSKSRFCDCFFPESIPVNVILTPKSNAAAPDGQLKRIVIPLIVPILEREPWLSRCLWVVVTLLILLLFLTYLRALLKKNRFHKYARIKNSYVVEDQLKETERNGKPLRKPGFLAWMNRWFNPFTAEKNTLSFSRPKTGAITFVATESKHRVGISRSSYSPKTMTIPNYSAAMDRTATGKQRKLIDFSSGTAIEIKKTDGHGTTRLGHLHFIVQRKDDERGFRILILLVMLLTMAIIVLLTILLLRGL